MNVKFIAVPSSPEKDFFTSSLFDLPKFLFQTGISENMVEKLRFTLNRWFWSRNGDRLTISSRWFENKKCVNLLLIFNFFKSEWIWYKSSFHLGKITHISGTKLPFWGPLYHISIFFTIFSDWNKNLD